MFSLNYTIYIEYIFSLKKNKNQKYFGMENQISIYGNRIYTQISKSREWSEKMNFSY